MDTFISGAEHEPAVKDVSEQFKDMEGHEFRNFLRNQRS